MAVRTDEPPAAKLARFILESGRVSSGQVNHRAFMPPRDLELSTYNIDALSPQEIWQIGDAVKSEQRKETLHGRADIAAEAVYAAKLRPVRDDVPPRHVVIVGWPDDKALQKNKAQLLAAAASYVPR